MWWQWTTGVIEVYTKRCMSEDEEKIVKLIKLAKEGDENAFEQIVATYSSQLFRLVYQIVLNYSDSEEILQETYYRFFLSLKRVKDQDPFPFIRKIALRRSYTFLKRRKKEISFDEIPEIESNFVVDGKNLELKEIYEVAYKLSPKRRIVFILKEILGFEYEEIAKEVGISETTVRRHYQLAKEEIQRKIKGL